jgi:tetratricopeptide (TPR) repeat protein
MGVEPRLATLARGLLGLAVLKLSLGAPRLARAADTSADAPMRAPLQAPGQAQVQAQVNDEKEARRLFQKAELSFNLGRFPEALTDYQSAYQAKPLPGFLFNIAQCYRNLGDHERARFFFKRYLALEPHAPNRRRVDDLIAEMTRQLDLDAKSARPVPAPETLPPPAPALPFPSRAPQAPPPGDTAALVTAALPPVAPLATPPARRPVWRRWWLWTGVGVVVAGGVVATVLLARPDVRAPGSLQPIDSR